MPIPSAQTLLLPVLRLLGDGAEHVSREIRERMRLQFQVTSEELRQKNKKGAPIFHNRVALALANLQGAPHGGGKAIEEVKNEVYRITAYGQAILSRNPTDLSRGDV